MIELINISKNYYVDKQEHLALKNINLKVLPGEIFGIIGPSGAGKSTLLRCINLLERPTSGQVIVDKTELTSLNKTELRQARHKIAMIFQHFNILSCRTAYENVALPLEFSGLKKADIHNKVMSLLELTGLSDKKNYYPKQLSGGQKQRVAIARALANEPSVLLCDEATSALDPQTTHSILQLLKDINHKLGLTLLIITHEMEVIKEACHRLAIMQHGEIIEQSEVIQFFSQPQTEIAKQFVRSSFKQHLPSSLRKRVLPHRNDNAIPLLQLTFIGKAAEEPFIAHLSRELNIELSILQANIETIRDQVVGIMFVEANVNEEKLKQGINYLISKNIHVEVIGYVKRDN